jgi:zinc protease
VVGEFVWQGPSTGGPSVTDSYAADAFSRALNWSTSRFRRMLVDSGACVSADVNWATQVNKGPIALSFEAVPEKAEACVTAIVGVLSDLRSSAYANDEDLSHAARELEVREVQNRQSPIEFAHTLAFWWTAASLDYYASYVDRLKAVTHADVERYVDTYISGKPYVLALLVSPEMKEKGLDAAHFEALLGLKKGAR